MHTHAIYQVVIPQKFLGHLGISKCNKRKRSEWFRNKDISNVAKPHKELP
jgi:hypothetical protein